MDADLSLTIEANVDETQLAAQVALAWQAYRDDHSQTVREAIEARGRLAAPVRPRATENVEHCCALDSVLVELESANAFVPYTFFSRFLWPPATPLRRGQRLFVTYVQNKLKSITTRGWDKGCIFRMPTGAGKSIAVDYLSVMTAATHVPDGINRIPNGVLIVAVPTVALAQEAYQRLYDKWSNYGQHVLESGQTLRRCPTPKLAAIANGRKYPLVPVKLLAGSSDVQGIIVRSSRNSTADPGGPATGTLAVMDIVYAAVCTYEHALLLLQAHRQAMPTPYQGLVGAHLSALVFDEAHYITESSRTAAPALHAWARAIEIPTVYMTATASPRLLERLGKTLQDVSVETVRESPLAISPHAYAKSAGELWTDLSAMLISQFMGWHADHRRGRMGVFIENKGLLKCMVCCLYTALQRLLPDPLYPSVEALMPDTYYQLHALTRLDTQTSCDGTPYGVDADPTWDAPFNEAVWWLSERGVHLTTGDVGTNVRRVQSRLYSNPGQLYCMIFATSALAEGVNMSGLRTVMITDATSRDTITLNATKVLQMIGRADREDLGGIVYVPPPISLRDPPGARYTGALLVDLVGPEVPIPTLIRLAADAGSDVVVRKRVLLERMDLNTILTRDALIEAIAPTLKVYTGAGKMPYVANGLVREMFAVIALKSERCAVCTMSRIVRLWGTDEWFPLHVFAASEIAITMLMQLPLAVIILIPLTLSQKRSSPKESTAEAARTERMSVFVEAQQALLGRDPGARTAWARIHNCVAQFVDNFHRPTENDRTLAGYRVYLPTITEAETMAISTYITASVYCCRDWERMSGEWATHMDMFRSIPMLFDYSIGILMDDVQLPLARAQRHMWRRSRCLQPNGDKYGVQMVGVENLFDAMYSPDSEVALGHPMQPMPGPVWDDDHPHLPPGRVVENHLLIVLAVAARRFDRYTRIDPEMSFGQVRRSLSEEEPRKYNTRVTLVPFRAAMDRSSETPTIAECIPADGTPLPDDVVVRGLDRFMAVDHWGRVPVTPVNGWDERHAAQARLIEVQTNGLRQKFERH
jgi:hypothetical protein